MNKIDWKRKLSSRKFWTSIVGFVTSIMIAFGADASTQTQVVAIIMAGASLIAYIISEGFIDSKQVGNNSSVTLDSNILEEIDEEPEEKDDEI